MLEEGRKFFLGMKLASLLYNIWFHGLQMNSFGFSSSMYVYDIKLYDLALLYLASFSDVSLLKGDKPVKETLI